jgi:hypothetical protein
VRKEICGFANGRQPAYLILGAEKVGGCWQLNGMDLGGDPPARVSDAIEGGLRPEPLVDVRSIQVQDGKHVAVIEVPPLAAPPCICRGTVYERVSGRTIPVIEPLRLADLYGRGEVARSGADAMAGEVATELIHDPDMPGWTEEWPRVAVVVAAAAQPEDISSRLFSQDFEACLEAVVREELITRIGDLPDFDPPTLTMGFGQSHRFIDCRDLHSLPGSRYWHVCPVWNGAVGVVGAWDQETVLPEHVVNELVRPAWKAASRLVGELGGYGPAYTQMRFDGSALGLQDGRPIDSLRISRGPMDEAPSDSSLASVERELLRSTGRPSYE